MAYIISKSTYVDVLGESTINLELPEHQSNDLIFIYLTNPGGTASIAGYTNIYNLSPSGVRSCAYYKVAIGSSETAVYSGSTSASFVIFVVRDADIDSPFDAQAASIEDPAATNTIVQAPNITVLESNSLLIEALHTNSAQIRTEADNVKMFMGISASQRCTFVQYEQLRASGIVPGTRFAISDNRIVVSAIAIKNKPSGLLGKTVSGLPTILERFNPFTSLVLGNFVDLATRITTFNGLPVEASPPLSINTYSGLPFRLNVSFDLGGNNTIYKGFCINFTSPLDLSGDFYSFPFLNGASNRYVRGSGFIYVEDSLGNWAGLSFDVNQDETVHFFGDFKSLAVIDSSGAVDFSDVVYFGWGFEKSSSTGARSFTLGTLRGDQPYLLVGGNEFTPLTPVDFIEVMNSPASPYYGYIQGLGQFLVTSKIQIGDGVQKTHYSSPSSSFEYPAKLRFYKAIEGTTGIYIKASPDCFIDFGSAIIRSATRQNFVIDPASSPLATYNFSGLTLQNFIVTWLTGVQASQASFKKCYLDAKGGNFVSCNFSQSSSLNAGVKAANGASFVSCTFAKGNDVYAIEITEPGSYDLSNSMFSGYATELNITASTGTVTIQLSGGQAQPSFISAGADVSFVQPSAGLTIQNYTAGSRVYVYNTTADGLIYNNVPAGATLELTANDGVGYTAGDSLVVRSAAVGRTGTALATASSSSFSATIQELADETYTALAIDGTLVTGYTINSVADRIAVTSSSFDLQNAYAWWWAQAQPTEVGIADYFRAFISSNVANFSFDTNVAPLLLDNTTASDLTDTSGVYLTRRDGIDPVMKPTSGGGALYFNFFDPVLIAVTGGGGGGATPAEIWSYSSRSLTSGGVSAIQSGLASDKIDTALELDGAVYRFTANALEQAAGGGGGDSAADVYAYFADGTRPDIFKADVSNLATASSISALNNLSSADVTAAVPTAMQVAAATRTDLATELARIDVPVSTRSTFDPTVTAVTTDEASRIASRADISGLPTLSEMEASTALTAGGDLSGLATQASVDAVSSKVDSLPTLAEMESSALLTAAADVSNLATQSSVNAIRTVTDQITIIEGAIKSTLDGEEVAVSNSTWTDAEKDQIRDALGVDGSKAPSAGGILQKLIDGQKIINTGVQNASKLIPHNTDI